MVKVWYPSNSQEEEMESYLDKGNRLGFSNKYGLPNSTTNYFYYVNTNTRQKPPIADGKFPVLIFSHSSNSEAYGFMDIPLIVNSSKINEAGKIAPLRSYEITHEIVLDFFNQHLYSQRSRFEELLNAYQEIEIKN